MTLGQKIKALRKEKKWTQAELAGDEITRNMLSLIESDTTLPSLPTLQYLAKRLGVPAGYFLDEETPYETYRKARVFPAIKKQFLAGNYKEVLRLSERDLAAPDDEAALLLAHSCTRLATEALHRGAMVSAERFVSRAKEYLAATAYPTEALSARLLVLEAVLRNIQAPKYEVTACGYADALTEAADVEFYRYVAETTEGYTFRDPILAAHVEAKGMIAAGRYADALRAMEAIEEKRTDRHFSLFVLFRLYGDIEHCHKSLGDFASAYRYSSKRMSLLSAFRG